MYSVSRSSDYFYDMLCFYRVMCLTAALLCFYSFRSSAQETAVRFQVRNAANEPVGYSTVTVISVPDTVHRVEKTADSTGLAVFQLVQGHPYLVRVTSVSYRASEKSITIKGDNPLYPLRLEPSSSSLGN